MSVTEELKALIRQMVDLERKVVDSSHSLNMIIGKQDQILSQLIKSNGDHEKRLRFLERTAAYGAGAAGLTMFLLKLFKVF